MFGMRNSRRDCGTAHAGAMRLHRWPCAMTLLATFVLLACPILDRAQGKATSEYQLKAAFLFNFAKFVDWPSGAFPSGKSPINLCVLGDDPFGDSLDDLIHGKTINNREIDIRRTRKFQELKNCQVVFISDSEANHLAEIFDGLRNSRALVVGESPEFAERGGGIQFYIENGRVRFSVNVDAIQRAQLTISAKLLSLARITHDGDRPRRG
jgi:hypothetical protein